jgi:hypothetical protein
MGGREALAVCELRRWSVAGQGSRAVNRRNDLRDRMALAGWSLAVALLVALGQALPAAEGTVAPRQILYHNGFEAGEEGLSPWWQNGEYTVNFAGRSEERAFKGKSSFKLDITFLAGTSCYWKGPRFYLPLQGSPTLRAALYVERGKARIGHGANLGASGMCGGGQEVRRHPSGWTEWEAENKPSAVDTDHLEWVAVYIDGGNGERVVLFVDEAEVEGTPLPELSARIEAEVKSEAIAQKRNTEVSFRHSLEQVRQDFDRVQRLRERVPGVLPPGATPWVQELAGRLRGYSETTFAQVSQEMGRLAAQGGTPGELPPLRSQLRYLEFTLNSGCSLPDFVKAHGERPYLVYVVPPIRNEKITPACFPVPGVIGDRINVVLCADEYGPASFALYAAEELRDVQVVASALAPVVPAAGQPVPQADLFLVKCWWQAGRTLTNCDPQNPVLTPELLLKDPDLVQVDNIKKRNVLQHPDGPQDAATLQRVTVPRGALQQYWITVHVPKQTPPGTYQGALEVTLRGAAGIRLPLSVTVLPFELEPPVLEYGIYYEAFLYDPDYYGPDTPKPHYNSLVRSREQYLAEMRDLKAHGVDHPACEDDMREKPDGTLDFSHIRRIWDLRQQAGLTASPIVKTRPGVPVSDYAYAKDPARQQELLTRIGDLTRQWMAFCKETGFPTPLIYGIDEAGGAVLAAERAAYKAVQEAGGMTGVAVGGGGVFFREAGDSLSRPIIQGGTTAKELRLVHEAGHKAWMYAGPQGGLEEPETYRRNYGLELWQRGFDGACTWAYQWPFGPSMWDDFDAGFEIRDHMMTYPAVNGPISTIQWEGWREACNDVRYLSTYLKLIEKAKAAPATRALAVDGERWLREVDLSGDLDLVRQELVERMLQLAR